MREGLLIVLSGPSGTGKGTLVKEIIKSREGIKLSVSATTRKPRKGEVDGESYFFVSTEKFHELVEKDELIEWVEYCGNLYGTPEKFVVDSMHNGIDVIFELEVEGAERILRKFPQCVMIFVVPPSFKELRKRIEKRGTEDRDAIEKRLKRAREEMEYINNYEYIVVNDKVKDAVEGINSIINAEKHKIDRNSDLISKLGKRGVS